MREKKRRLKYKKDFWMVELEKKSEYREMGLSQGCRVWNLVNVQIPTVYFSFVFFFLSFLLFFFFFFFLVLCSCSIPSYNGKIGPYPPTLPDCERRKDVIECQLSRSLGKGQWGRRRRRTTRSSHCIADLVTKSQILCSYKTYMKGTMKQN